MADPRFHFKACRALDRNVSMKIVIRTAAMAIRVGTLRSTVLLYKFSILCLGLKRRGGIWSMSLVAKK